MNQMSPTQFRRMNLEDLKAALPVEVITEDETLFFAVKDNPETRSAVNTFTEDQVIHMMADCIGGAAPTETARRRVAKFKSRGRA